MLLNIFRKFKSKTEIIFSKSCDCRFKLLNLHDHKRKGTTKKAQVNNIKLLQGDITKEAKDFDAIVNAANNSLLGGGGVDGAIHWAAGPELFEECKTLGGCPTGQAKATDAYRIPCKKIIHTVGPVYNAKNKLESQTMLASAYRNSMETAKSLGMKSVLFPSISTGIYGYPVEAAAKIALSEALIFLAHNPEMELAWVLFTEDDFNIYKKVLNDLLGY